MEYAETLTIKLVQWYEYLIGSFLTIIKLPWAVTRLMSSNQLSCRHSNGIENLIVKQQYWQ